MNLASQNKRSRRTKDDLCHLKLLGAVMFAGGSYACYSDPWNGDTPVGGCKNCIAGSSDKMHPWEDDLDGYCDPVLKTQTSTHSPVGPHSGAPLLPYLHAQPRAGSASPSGNPQVPAKSLLHAGGRSEVRLVRPVGPELLRDVLPARLCRGAMWAVIILLIGGTNLICPSLPAGESQLPSFLPLPAPAQRPWPQAHYAEHPEDWPSHPPVCPPSTAQHCPLLRENTAVHAVEGHCSTL